MLKAEVERTTGVLNKLFQIIRDQQKIPEDWNDGLLKIGELKTWKLERNDHDDNSSQGNGQGDPLFLLYCLIFTFQILDSSF